MCLWHKIKWSEVWKCQSVLLSRPVNSFTWHDFKRTNHHCKLLWNSSKPVMALGMCWQCCISDGMSNLAYGAASCCTVNAELARRKSFVSFFAMCIKQRCNQNQPESWIKSSLETFGDDFHISLTGWASRRSLTCQPCRPSLYLDEAIAKCLHTWLRTDLKFINCQRQRCLTDWLTCVQRQSGDAD